MMHRFKILLIEPETRLRTLQRAELEREGYRVVESDSSRAGLRILETDSPDLVVIDPAGQKFDPHRHQAMSMVEGDAPANHVVQVFQKGYLLNDRVLRPAMVAVAKPRAGDAG